MSEVSDTSGTKSGGGDQDGSEISQAPTAPDHGVPVGAALVGVAGSTPVAGSSEELAWLKRLHGAAYCLRGIFVGWTIILLTISVSIAIFVEMCQQSKIVTVEPIGVPKQISDQGYTAHVAAQHLISEIYKIQKSTRTSMGRSLLKPGWAGHEFLLPNTGLSIESVVARLNKYFGWSPKTITGELLYAELDGGLSLRLRIDGENVPELPGENGKRATSQLLEIGARRVVMAIEPFILAAHYYDKKDYPKAKDILKHILANHVGTEHEFRAINMQGLLLQHDKEPEKAIEKYKRVLELSPRFAAAYGNWGNALALQGQFADAINKYEEAVRFDPKFAGAYHSWGNALALQGQLADAINKYEEAVRFDPKYAGAYHSWGNALALQGHLADAINKYEEAVRFDPKYAGAYHSWGNALALQGHLADAIEKYEEAVRFDPKFAGAYHSWGNALALQGQLADAINKYEEAVRFDPKYAGAYHSWGNALALQGHLADAIEKYEEAVRFDPGLAGAYHSWGNALANLGQLEDAIKKYEEAVRFDPEYAPTYHNWGTALTNLGQLEDAIKKYEEAVKFDPEYAPTYHNWGTALTNLGQLEDAIKKYEEAVKFDPELAGAYRSWGDALSLRGDCAEARIKYEEATRLDGKLSDSIGICSPSE